MGIIDNLKFMALGGVVVSYILGILFFIILGMALVFVEGNIFGWFTFLSLLGLAIVPQIDDYMNKILRIKL